MALKLSSCTKFAPALKPSNLSSPKPLSLQSRAPRTSQRIMSSAAGIKKGQEQFVDDKSTYGALQGVKVVCAQCLPQRSYKLCVCLLCSVSQAWLVSEQKQVDVGSLWNDDDVLVLVAARSMG